MTKQDKHPLTGTATRIDATREEAGRDAPNPEALRTAAGLSAEDMAALLGMGDYGYAAWERGVRQPGGPARKLLALIATDPAKMIARLRTL